MKNIKRILKEKILESHPRENILSVILFGSSIGDSFSDLSDIDLLFVFTQKKGKNQKKSLCIIF